MFTTGVLPVLFVVLRLCFCNLDTSAAEARANQPTQAVFCADSKGRLKWPRGQIIKVSSANYGRLTGSVCPPALNDITNCSASSSLDTARCLCEDKSSCALFSSDHVFGDPCVGTSKYLQIEFRCIGAHTVKCEDFFWVTGCPNNEKIDVELSSYGGRNASLPAPEQETRRICLFLPIVQILEDYQGQSTCTFGAARFNDCIGRYKYKYYKLRYKCL